MSDPSDVVKNAHVSDSSLLAADYELHGSVNRATRQGAKFSLIMAMLEQDCLHRPYVEKNIELDKTAKDDKHFSHYRSNPLSANDDYWSASQHTSQLIQSGHVHSAHLWLAMHPEPLSQHNNPDVIDEDVIANCNINTQNRLQQAKETKLKVDETGLYEILQELV